MATPPQKVSLSSVNDLKNATDDALAPYLTSLPKPYTFKQQHLYTNVRLIVGYTTVAIAGVLFYADWKLGWDATKAYTLPACVIYFTLNGFLTYWIWGIEAGTIFVGVREGGQKLSLKSSIQKHKPVYKLKVRYEPPSGTHTWQEKEIEGTFMQWFNNHGYLQQKELKRWLAQNIEVIGLADPESKQVAEKIYDGIVDDAVIAAMVSTSAESPSVASTTKAKKPKKKA